MYAPKTIFIVNLEYVVEPANLYVIFPNMGALWCSWIMALLDLLGPDIFSGYH